MSYAQPGVMAVHADESWVVWKAVQLCKPASLESYCYCSCPACPPTRRRPLCWQSLCPSCCRRHPPQRQRLLLRSPLLLSFLRQVRHIESSYIACSSHAASQRRCSHACILLSPKLHQPEHLVCKSHLTFHNASSKIVFVHAAIAPAVLPVTAPEALPPISVAVSTPAAALSALSPAIAPVAITASVRTSTFSLHISAIAAHLI